MRRRVWLLAWLGLAACTAGPDYRPPALAVADQWHAAADAGAVTPEWWRSFGDETLDRLVDEALAGNPGIEQALARVEQADAVLGARRAELRPSGQVDGSVARAEQSLNSGFGLLSRFVPDYPRTVTDAGIGVGATWELDLAGGVRRRREAARASLAEAAAGLAAARLLVVADLTDAYWALRAAQARRREFEVLVATARAEHALLAGRVRLGGAANQSLDAAGAQLARIEGELAGVQAAVDTHHFRILALLGRSRLVPEPALASPAPIADAPNPAAGLPADILRRRPDIVAAEQRLIAANAGIGAAMAEYYPRLSLSALVGLRSFELKTLPSSDSAAALAGLGLRWRLFDFGRIDAEIRLARGRTREALAAYRETVVNAARDVELCFTSLAAAREDARRREEAQAREAAVLATTGKAQLLGGASREAVLAGERRLVEAKLATVLARETSARTVTACYRALGIAP